MKVLCHGCCLHVTGMRTLKSYARALDASFLRVQCAFRIQPTIRKIPQPDALKRFKIYAFHDYLMNLRYKAKLQTRSPNEKFPTCHFTLSLCKSFFTFRNGKRLFRYKWKKEIKIFNTPVKIAKEFSHCLKIYEIINVLSSLIYFLGKSVFKQAIIIKCTFQRPKFKVNLLSMCQELGTNTLFKF